MAHRDFAARRGTNNKKKSKGKNKNTLIAVAVAAVIVFGGALYFLKSKPAETVAQPVAVQPEKTQPKSVLPNRPEEVWSYIKALETRTVPVDDNPASVEKNMRLTPEQRQTLLQMEKEQKAMEEAKKAAEQQKAEDIAKAETAKAQAEAQAKAEAKKAAEAAKKVDTVKKPEPVKTETAKTETAKPVNKPAEQPATTTSGGKKFGLQCGAFKNRAQAESLQGRLVMAGLNAQVQVNAEWNRVRVGGFADRDSAVQAQSKAKSVADCVVIGM